MRCFHCAGPPIKQSEETTHGFRGTLTHRLHSLRQYLVFLNWLYWQRFRQEYHSSNTVSSKKPQTAIWERNRWRFLRRHSLAPSSSRREWPMPPKQQQRHRVPQWIGLLPAPRGNTSPRPRPHAQKQHTSPAYCLGPAANQKQAQGGHLRGRLEVPHCIVASAWLPGRLCLPRHRG